MTRVFSFEMEVSAGIRGLRTRSDSFFELSRFQYGLPRSENVWCTHRQ